MYWHVAVSSTLLDCCLFQIIFFHAIKFRLLLENVMHSIPLVLQFASIDVVIPIPAFHHLQYSSYLLYSETVHSKLATFSMQYAIQYANKII